MGNGADTALAGLWRVGAKAAYPLPPPTALQNAGAHALISVNRSGLSR